MKVRSSYAGFTDVADGFLAEVFQRVANLQFQKGDGPIIAFQVLHILPLSFYNLFGFRFDVIHFYFWGRPRR